MFKEFKLYPTLKSVFSSTKLAALATADKISIEVLISE